MYVFYRYGLKNDYGRELREPLRPSPPRPGYGPALPHPPNPPVPQTGSVMMVYGLNIEKVNPDKLFNIFCLYGNVIRVSRIVSFGLSFPLFSRLFKVIYLQLLSSM